MTASGWARHVPDRRLRIEKDVVGDVGNIFLHLGIFKNRASVNENLALVLTIYAGYVANYRGFTGAVGTDKTVDGTAGHLDIQLVERLEAVKTLDHILDLNHDL